MNGYFVTAMRDQVIQYFKSKLLLWPSMEEPVWETLGETAWVNLKMGKLAYYPASPLIGKVWENKMAWKHIFYKYNEAYNLIFLNTCSNARSSFYYQDKNRDECVVGPGFNFILFPSPPLDLLWNCA